MRLLVQKKKSFGNELTVYGNGGQLSQGRNFFFYIIYVSPVRAGRHMVLALAPVRLSVCLTVHHKIASALEINNNFRNFDETSNVCNA